MCNHFPFDTIITHKILNNHKINITTHTQYIILGDIFIRVLIPLNKLALCSSREIGTFMDTFRLIMALFLDLWSHYLLRS